MKTAMKLIILSAAILLGLASCAPKAIVVEPVAPHVARARAEVQAAANGSRKVKESVGAVHEQAKGIAAEVNKATAEVERLKAKPTVDPAEFDALWLLMTDLQTHTWAHEIKARDAVAETVEQEHLQQTADRTLEALETTAETHDEQTAELKVHLGKVEKQAAVGGVYRTWVIIVAIVLILALLIQFWKPPFLR